LDAFQENGNWLNTRYGKGIHAAILTDSNRRICIGKHTPCALNNTLW